MKVKLSLFKYQIKKNDYINCSKKEHCYISALRV